MKNQVRILISEGKKAKRALPQRGPSQDRAKEMLVWMMLMWLAHRVWGGAQQQFSISHL
jgi:hypothetical protein